MGHPSIGYSLNYIRPDQGVGNILAIVNQANSSYNSLQVTLHHFHKVAGADNWLRRILQPDDFAVVYTYSHSIDEASDRFESNFVDSYNLRANRASSDFDQRQLLTMSYIYRLPLSQMAHSLWRDVQWRYKDPNDQQHPAAATTAAEVDYPPDDGPSHLTRMLLDNWSLSGITLFQTGTPFSVVNGASSDGISVLDNAGLALGENADSYPDLNTVVGGCPITQGTPSPSTFGPLLRSPCRFVAPRGLTQGTAGRNSLNNPGRNNWDMALLKDMKLKWRESNLQFRAEAFNIFNQTQFIIYDPLKGNTSANTVTCYGDEATGYSAGAATCGAGNGFLRPIEAHRPRTLQFGLKFSY
jgi:hypothetical protein